MSTTKDLLAEIRAGATALGIAPSTLCKRAVRHGGLVRRLKNGGNVTLQTAEKVRGYIQAHAPSSRSDAAVTASR